VLNNHLPFGAFRQAVSDNASITNSVIPKFLFEEEPKVTSSQASGKLRNEHRTLLGVTLFFWNKVWRGHIGWRCST
jgi:hypothetical protein